MYVTLPNKIELVEALEGDFSDRSIAVWLPMFHGKPLTPSSELYKIKSSLNALIKDQAIQPGKRLTERMACTKHCFCLSYISLSTRLCRWWQSLMGECQWALDDTMRAA